MRVTSKMLADTTLRNLNTIMARLEHLQDQITSGRRVRRPSDDPAAVVSALTFRSSIDETEQYIRNINNGVSWLGVTDTQLGSLNDALTRAKELAIQGGSDTVPSQARRDIAEEVAQLLEHAIQVGNSTYAGYYLFSGAKTTTAPFSPVRPGPNQWPTSVDYTGDQGQILRGIGVGVDMAVNTPGDAVFAPAFTALINLRDALSNNDASGINAALAQIDNAFDSVLSARAQGGAKINRLENAKTRHEDVKINLTELLSQVQDLDLAEAVTALSMEEMVYRAALAASGRALQPTLLDFLR